MQYKFPRKVTVSGVTFKVIYNKNWRGGELQFPSENEEAYIKIGTAALQTNPLEFLDIVIHEGKEIIQILQGTRYTKPDELAYEFHYDHRQHTDLCTRLSAFISNFIK